MIRWIHLELFSFLLTNDSAAILSDDGGEIELHLVSVWLLIHISLMLDRVTAHCNVVVQLWLSPVHVPLI